MKFKKFLETPIDEKLPIEKVKEDFVFYKNMLQITGKEDILYNNLFDNIFWMLKNKFNNFSCLYKDIEVMYSELTTILYSQVPQFLFIQKKQLLESLNTFGDINNWGSTMREQVKRDLKLIEETDNSSGYIPIDSNDVDAYSKDNTNRINTKDETTTDNRNTVDFLYFFSRMKWNTASIELTTILKPYYSLFLAFDVRDYDVDYSINEFEELEERVEKNELDIDTLKWADENIAKEIERIDNTQTQDFIFLSNKFDSVDSNLTEIKQSISDLDTKVDTNVQEINQTIQSTKTELKNEIDNNYKEFQETSETTNNTLQQKAWINAQNIFSANQLFQYPIQLLSSANPSTMSYSIKDSDSGTTLVNKRYVDNKIAQTDLSNYYNKTEVDSLLTQKASLTGNNSFSGQNSFTSPINMNNQSIYNLSNPNNQYDAATKNYVDNWFRRDITIWTYNSYNLTWRTTRRTFGNGYAWVFSTDTGFSSSSSPPYVIGTQWNYNADLAVNTWWNWWMTWSWKFARVNNNWHIIFVVYSDGSSNDDYQLIINNSQFVFYVKV